MRYRWFGDVLVTEVCRVREPLAARFLDMAQVGYVVF